MVHRDLKPENILLDSERNVRVADFGFGNNWHKDRHLTTYCGSPFYAAPEMVSGTPYIGPETDVWSLGVILYVLVCGRLPFDASDLPALFAQIKRGNYQKPREGSIGNNWPLRFFLICFFDLPPHIVGGVLAQQYR